MKKGFWFVIMLLALVISGYSLTQYLILGAERAGFVVAKNQLLGQMWPLWYFMLYVHLIFGSLALIIGPFMFIEKLRQKYLNQHKFFGRVYLTGILLGGLSGVYLAFYSTGGTIAQFGFGFLSVFWLISGYLAYRNIREKKVKTHRVWMIRNFSLTLAAVTLRIWLPLLLVLFGIEQYESVYMAVSWLAWVPNIIAAEIYIRKN